MTVVTFEAAAPRERTIPGLLARRAEHLAGKPLFRFGELERSYAEMAEAVARTAGTLSAYGIVAGDRVAVMSENRCEALDLMLGCPWMGAIVVPINPALRGPGLEHQLRNSEARLLVVEEALVAALLTVSIPPTLEQVWTLADAAEHDAPGGRLAVPVRPLPDSPGPVPAAAVTPATVAAILYTSGTTGPAKGVQCPHAQFYWWGHQVATQLEIAASDVLYTCLPVYHVNAFGAFFQALVAGATFHLGPRFSASRMLDRLIESRATVTYLLGAMVSMVELRPPSGTDRAHQVTRALAPASSARQMATFQDRFGIELVEAYGSTETNAVIGAPLGQQRSGWMGQVRDGFEARVVDEEDNPVPDGQPGELVLRAREPFALSVGYYREPGKTVEAWRNLWFHTGDQVERSPDGWFRFRDRLSDSIRRRGENISSFDVEEVIRAHPRVEQAAAYALPSELGEDEVAVAVVPVAGASLSEEEVVRWCEPRLAYFAVPRYVRFVAELPLTENGKVRKAVLRAAAAASCWDREAAGIVLAR